MRSETGVTSTCSPLAAIRAIRLVESGNGTSPTDLLSHRALAQGESCATYYRITAQSGLYICENAQNVLVASTYDFVTDSPVSVR